MGSYRWGYEYKSANMDHKYSYPTYNPTYIVTLNPKPQRTPKYGYPTINKPRSYSYPKPSTP